MQKNIVGLILLGSLIGCTSDWDPGKRDSRSDSRAGTEQDVPALSRPQRASFAALPDRGELLAYDRDHDVRQRGAYTSYPVDLSESHAFRASHENGEMVVTAPNGELLRIKYDHHVEHSDGSWSWIGRAPDGADAVLTFGEKAVFGAIPHRGQESFRVTTAGGRAWLVATDRSKIPDINRAVTRTGKPDYLIPPSFAASPSSSGPGVSSASGQMEAMSASTTTIDVLLGFTNGYAAQLGGTSQANTRLNNLIMIANQALTNSHITSRFRLVHTVQVNYPDATNNANALEEVTGYRSGAGFIPVPAALQPLHTARDQYGADVVSLVRAFRAPQNDGCGIAWLIGSGQRPIVTADERFAYSVVGDGFDLDEGDNRTYFCREETLVHEMGHNMGQAHNSEDSTSAGAHAYSYGYREASGSGFYTIMAYRLAGSNQFAIRHFANPNINYAGRPTGVANASDNARSLNLTMPIVATFRTSVVAEAKIGQSDIDIDGDGRSDLLWYNSDLQRIAYWVMNGNGIARHGGQLSGGGYRVLTTGDYNGDGRSDVIWRGPQGDLQMWFSNGTDFVWQPFVDGTGLAGQPYVNYPNGWLLVASADMDGDGRDDIIWYHPELQRIAYWVMNGNTIARHGGQPSGSGYRVLTTGDYNGDGRVDLVWYGPQGDLQLWFSNGTDFLWQPFVDSTVGGQPNVNYPGGWLPVTSADMDGDGRDDIIWYHPDPQRIAYWVMNSNMIVRHGGQSSGSDYRVLTTGDYNGDGRVDLVWRGAQNDLQMWFSNGTGFAWQPFVDSTGLAGQPYVNYPAGWQSIGSVP